MPLSDTAKKTLEYSEQANATRQREQEAQRQQDEKEYNDLVRQEQELQNQLLQEQLRQEQQRSQVEILEQEKAQKIAALLEQRATALENVPKTITIVKKGEDEIRPASRKQISIYQNEVIREYKSLINQVSTEYSNRIDQIRFQEKYPNAQLGRTALNQVESGLSRVEAYERQETNLEAKRQRQRQTDIAKGQSYIDAERAKINKIVAEFDQQKEENNKTQTKAVNALFTLPPTKAGDLLKKQAPPERQLYQPEPNPIEPNYTAIESFEKTQKAKSDFTNKVLESKPKQEPLILSKEISDKSNAFLTRSPGNAKTIIGKDKTTSKKAVYTFEQTQAQQEELFKNITGASSSKEAIKLKEQAQALNPYVGTPQTANTKKGKAEQGVLIEKVLESPKEVIDDYYSNTPVIIPGSTEITETETTITRNYWTLPDPENPGQNLKDRKGRELQFLSEESAMSYAKRTGMTIITQTTSEELAKPVSYDFVDEKGNVIKPTIEMLWKKMNENYDPPKPTKADIDFNKSLREYMNTNPNQEVEIYKEVEGLKTPLDELPFEKAYLQHGTELNYAVQNVFRPKNDQIEYEHTLEGAGFSDLDSSAGNLLLNENNKPQNNFEKYIDENIHTIEGQQKLAGSIVGSAIVAAASFVIPGLAVAKYQSKFVTPKNLARAKEIADELSYVTHQEKNKLPTTLDDMNAILRENKKAVGVEMLNPQTALIKIGTETAPEQTPYVVVRFASKRNAERAALYQGFQTEKPGSYNEIIVYGKQGNELKYGHKVGKDSVSYPTTLSNFKKAYDPQNLAGVGSKQEVLLSDLEKYPKQVIKSVEAQDEVKGAVILETKRLSTEASEIKTKISKDAGDQFKGDLGSKEFDYYFPEKQTMTKPFKKLEAPKEKSIDSSISNPSQSGKPSTVLDNTKTTTGSPGETIKIPSNTKELEKFIKSSEGVKTYDKIYGLTMTGSISSTISGIRSQTDSSTKQMEKQQSRSTQSTRQELSLIQEHKIDLELETKSNINRDTMEKIILDINQKRDQRRILDPLFSLVTSTDTIQETGQGQSTRQKEEYILKERLEETFPKPTPNKERYTFKTPPRTPGITLDLEEKKEVKSLKPKGKFRVSFFRWNTNTESVGQYLPTRDLSVGRTAKTISKVDALQKRVNKKGYSKKQQEKVDRYYSGEIKENKGGAFVKKANIINISEPKGKQARKFLKRFKVDFGF